jgi:hypothetical protein
MTDQCPTCGCPTRCAEGAYGHLRDALVLARRVIDPNQHDVIEEIDMALAYDGYETS